MWLLGVLSAIRSLKRLLMPNASVMQATLSASSTMATYMSSTWLPERGLKIVVLPLATSCQRAGTAESAMTASRYCLRLAFASLRVSPLAVPGSPCTSSQ